MIFQAADGRIGISHTACRNDQPIDHPGVSLTPFFRRYFFEGGVHSHQLLRGAREETLFIFLNAVRSIFHSIFSQVELFLLGLVHFGKTRT
jgi:hypothetical protein